MKPRLLLNPGRRLAPRLVLTAPPGAFDLPALYIETVSLYEHLPLRDIDTGEQRRRTIDPLPGDLGVISVELHTDRIPAELVRDH